MQSLSYFSYSTYTHTHTNSACKNWWNRSKVYPLVNCIVPVWIFWFWLFFGCPVVSDSEHNRPPCSLRFFGVCPSLDLLHGWCHPGISFSDTLFSFCPQCFPASRTFPESAVYIIWPKYWSFSISPSNEYSGLISLKIDGLISLLSKGLSGISSSTTVQIHQFFGILPFLWSSFHNRRWPLGRRRPWLYRALLAE